MLFDDKSPLILLYKCHDTDLFIKLLDIYLQNGADINYKNNNQTDRNTLLNYVIGYRSNALVNIVLDKGANPNLLTNLNKLILQKYSLNLEALLMVLLLSINLMVMKNYGLFVIW